MCRTGGRRCPSHSNPEKIAARNAQRRETYKTRKQSNLATFENLISPVQIEFFKNSKAVNADGTLITLYHGSAHEFTSFDPSTLGKGNDSWGNGFYFTDQKQTAEGYAKESGSPTANVKEFYLNLENPIYVDGKENMSLNNVLFTAEQAKQILKHHPNVYLQPDSEDEMNILGDYAPNYWDKTSHTKEEFDKMIDQVAEEYFSDASWVELENVFGKEHGAQYLQAIHNTTGNDGVVVDFGEDGKHYVAWFNNQMKLTSNTNPTKEETTF